MAGENLVIDPNGTAASEVADQTALDNPLDQGSPGDTKGSLSKFAIPPAEPTSVEDLASSAEVFQPGDNELFVPQAEKTPKAAATASLATEKSPDAKAADAAAMPDPEDGPDVDLSNDPMFASEQTKPNKPVAEPKTE